jgi:ribose transport system substrate-binding protein
VNAEALTPVIEEAYNRGVVVVTTASKLETDKYTAALVSDETEFGRAGGTWLVEKLGGKGNVIILDGMSGIATADQRRAGAMSVFAKHPDIKVVAREFADWDYAKGKMATENMLAANPVINGVWSSGGDMTRGAIEAFVENGRSLVPMTGEDGNGFLKLWKKYIDDPGFDSIATTMPAWIYGEGVNTGIRILKGEPYEKEVVNPVPTILRDTLDQYVREDLNDSFWANTRLPEELIQKFYAQ